MEKLVYFAKSMPQAMEQQDGQELSFNQRLLAVLDIPGLQYVFDRRKHPVERIFWLLVILAAIWGMLFLCQYQYDRYRASPTAIQLDKDYRDWVGIMPGLTFCFHDRIDWNRAWEYLERIQLTDHAATREGLSVNETSGTYQRFLAEFVETLVDATATNLGNLSHFLTDSLLATDVNILELISTVGARDFPVRGGAASLTQNFATVHCTQVHPSHDIAINSFLPAHQARLQVHQIVTEHGICYALNAPLTFLQQVNGTNGHTALNKGFPDWKPIECEFSKHLCYMKLDMFRSTVSYTIHSPYELATSDQLFTNVQESDELVSLYSLFETVADERLKELTVHQRNCYFYDESYEHLSYYSRNLCIMNCRAKRALAACRCRPHFYPFAEGPVCNVAGLHCLQQHPDWNWNRNCKCLKSCTDVDYNVASLSKTQWTAEGGIPFTHKASLRWEILQPTSRLRRVLIFSYEDLLVSFGGAIALFCGKNGLYLSNLFEFFVIELATFIQRMFNKRKQKKRRKKHVVRIVEPK
uniref:Sodium channel protein Nach n=1 Tax=Anopheles epiroticus TaxID=199890 RepID=A0A182PHU5_9DIPT